ncbi:MAG: DNA replication/repair protein RecF [Fimbriimonadaceae bacterium]|nr:DNA replication/repair protein RecF [Fimbriimonadaceae bacterium]
MTWLDRLVLRDYRNIESVNVTLDQRFNVFAGLNAQGKTSLLESIYLISTSRVLRGSRDVEAIRDGADESSVKGILGDSLTEIGVNLGRGKRKKGLINGLGLPRASDLIGRLPSVCFWSGDLTLATGDPAGRRIMLDTELSQVFPAYLKAFSIYKRALEQRNALLKQAQERHVPNEVFEGWEASMAVQGGIMRQFRIDWVEALRPHAKATHAHMGEGEEFDLQYALKDEGELSEKYSELRSQEIARGSTLFGPHRDDLELFIEGRPVRQYGSQGQQRTAVISLKLAVLHTAQETLGFPPVLLLDDIFSDLDLGRRVRLVEAAMQAGGQVFITCTEAEQAGELLQNAAKVFRVHSGQVSNA